MQEVALEADILGAQAMNDSRELKRRLMKYLIPVVALSIAMNVTKFFEIRLVFDEYVVDTVDGYNITEWRWANKAEDPQPRGLGVFFQKGVGHSSLLQGHKSKKNFFNSTIIQHFIIN